MFYGKIDIENIGIAGHSQGGVGAINAVTEQSNGNIYTAIWAASTISRYHADEMNKNGDGWSCSLSNIHIPIFMVAGTKDFDAGNMTAWFMYSLKGDTEAGKAFLGEDAFLLPKVQAGNDNRRKGVTDNRLPSEYRAAYPAVRRFVLQGALSSRQLKIRFVETIRFL